MNKYKEYSIRAPLKLSTQDNIKQVVIHQAGTKRCLCEVPAAPESIIGNCIYYYRPYGQDDMVCKTGVNFKKILDYAVKHIKTPKEGLDIFDKLINNEDTLIPAHSSDPNWSRWHNFMARHTGCNHSPPSYYISYGYYYCSNFNKYLITRMQSTQGELWVINARKLLQKYMDEGLLENNDAQEISTPSRRYPQKKPKTITVAKKHLELTDDIFKEFAFASHVAAYLDAGIADVPIADLMRVFGQPNVEEWADTETWKQAIDVAWEVVPQKVSHPIDSAIELVSAGRQFTEYVVEENINNIRRGYGYMAKQANQVWQWMVPRTKP